MTLSLPNWPPARLLNEAATGWNLRHPKQKLDWRTCCWSRLRVAVFAFIRHKLTDYDSELRTFSDTRAQLRKEILSAALCHYPWLRSDPRSQILDPTHPVDELAILNEVGRTVSGLLSLKHQLLDRLREPASSPAQKARIRKQLIELEYQLQHGQGLLDIDPDPFKGYAFVWSLVDHNDYGFDGRTLHPNQTRPLKFSCPRCGARVLVSKRAVPVGQGHRWLLCSCHCMGAIVTSPSRLRLGAWVGSLAEIPRRGVRRVRVQTTQST